MITIIIIIVTMRIFVSDLLVDLPGSSKKNKKGVIVGLLKNKTKVKRTQDAT